MNRGFPLAAAAGLVVLGLIVAACGSGAAKPAAFSGPGSAGDVTARAAGAAAAQSASPSAKPPPPPHPHVTVTRTYASDGTVITIAVFHGPVRYVLHDGSQDPGYLAGPVKAGSVIGAAERKELLAAFNGGFKMSAGAGGYEQEGHVAVSLRDGLASLVIYKSGQATIGVWGQTVPVPGERAYSVRQNLQPLVLHGKPAPASYDWGLWGATLGGGEYVARSAVGEDAAGDLIYAGSMSTTPYDLARALARYGARTAMELDINPAWVQLDVASHPGGALRAAVYGQNRPAGQFLYGWTRDFFTVLAG
jgi:hypothetical protein